MNATVSTFDGARLDFHVGGSRNPAPGGKFTYGNFTGRGWRRFAHSRPVNHFDLAAKVHDLHYHYNKVSFADRPAAQQYLQSRLGKLGEVFRYFVSWDRAKVRETLRNAIAAGDIPDHQRKQISRLAKADRIFRLMNHHRAEMRRKWGYRDDNAVVRFLNKMSRSVFLDSAKDAEFYVRGDGFANLFVPLAQPAGDQCPTEPERMNATDTMRSFGAFIPRRTLAHPPLKTIKRVCLSSGKLLHDRVPDHEALVAEEHETDLFSWFNAHYGPVMDDIRALDDQTGEELVPRSSARRANT